MRFSLGDRIVYYDPGDFLIDSGQSLIVPTPAGLDLALAATSAKEVIQDDGRQPLLSVDRIATEDDKASMSMWEMRIPEVTEHVLNHARELGLAMRPTGARISFDGSRLLISYSAPETLDLAELRARIEGRYDTRIEFRHAGSRDAARQTGDLGRCGYTLCCVRYLHEFPPVAIKMAKNQDLPLNPDKISGACGRLLCCLAYENDDYLGSPKPGRRNRTPKPGTKIVTKQGPGVARRANVLRESVAVELDSGDFVDIPLSEKTG